MTFISTITWKHSLLQTVTKHRLNIYLRLCCVTSCNQIQWKKRFADTVKIALIWIFPPASFLWRNFDILIMTIRKPTGNRDTAAELWMGFIDVFCGSGMEIKVWIQYHNITLALRIFSRAPLYYTISLSKSSLSGEHNRPGTTMSLSNRGVAIRRQHNICRWCKWNM